MGRILIVSNRLPVSVTRVDDQLTFKRSVGGVATGLSSLDSPVETHWIGWPGIASDRLSDADRDQIDGRMAEENCSTVHLSEDVVRRYYLGFSNTTIWPLFHYFAQHAEYDQRTWQSYLEGIPGLLR